MSHYKRPGATAGMSHLALNVSKLDECLDFYSHLLGMVVEWRPDEDNYYLTSGNDNLALHRVKMLSINMLIEAVSSRLITWVLSSTKRKMLHAGLIF